MASLTSPSLRKHVSSPLSKPSFAVPKTRGLRVTGAMTRSRPAAAATNMYELLSVPETAGPEEIKAAYRRQARRWHPDACPNAEDRRFFAEQFMRTREAYEVLADPDRRQDYDLALRLGAGAASGNWSAALGGGPLFRRRGGARARAAAHPVGFGNWEDQLVGLENRETRPGRESTWGSRMRRANTSPPSES